jgi:hypothetical protein
MKKLDLKNAKIQHGQMIIPSGSLDRNSPLHPRNGAPKRQCSPEPAWGMTRRSQGALSAHIHGIALQDEPATAQSALKSYEKPVGVHPGMTATQKAKFDPKAASEHLRAAGQLSRKE